MDSKVKPIAYSEFRFKYFCKGKVPVHGSEELINLNSFLNGLINGIILIVVLLPLAEIRSDSSFVFYYIAAVFLVAIWKPMGYLDYRISFYRYHRYD